MGRVPPTFPLPADPPVPAPPHTPDFEISPWSRGQPMIHVGPRGYDANQPYVSPRPYRFSDFDDPIAGAAVPTYYAAANLTGALAETVFHDIPPRSATPRVVAFDRLLSRVVARVIPRRTLKLADFTSAGLTGLGLDRREIIETVDPDLYLDTVKWAHAVYTDPETFDGIHWISRLDDTCASVVLFGGRVRPEDLEHDPARDMGPLTMPGTVDDVLDIASRRQIDIVGLPWLR